MAFGINSRGIQVVLEQNHGLVLHPEIFGTGEPVGLMIHTDGPQPVRLVAQFGTIQTSETATTLDLAFPKTLDVQQGERIKGLFQSLKEHKVAVPLG
jgi:hypothetical protein